MGYLKALNLSPQAELHFSFSKTINSGAVSSVPAFLSTQQIKGSVNATYRDAAFIGPDDTLQITFVGTYNIKSWIAGHSCGDLWDLKTHTEEVVKMGRSFTINPDSSTVGRPPMSRKYDFCFQPCRQSTQTVRFGSPMPRAHEEHLAIYDASEYGCSYSLPSSTHKRFTYPRPTNSTEQRGILEVNVNYHIRASLLQPITGGSKELAHSVNLITILDSTVGPQPPLCVTDYPREYCLLQQAVASSGRRGSITRILSHQSRKKLPLFADAVEPQPLIFAAVKQYATTVVPVTLTLLTHEDGIVSTGMNVRTSEVAISWQLQKSSFCSMKGLKKSPNLDNIATRNNNRTLLREVSNETGNTYKCIVNDWQRDNSATLRHKQISSAQPQVDHTSDKHYQNDLGLKTSTSSDSFFAIADSGASTPPTLSVGERGIPHSTPTQCATISIPIGIPRSELLAPTSFTSYIAVRYSLLIRIQACFGGGGQLHRNDKVRWTGEVKLEVPIQVVYETDDEIRDCISHTSCLTVRNEMAVDALQVHAEILPKYEDRRMGKNLSTRP